MISQELIYIIIYLYAKEYVARLDVWYEVTAIDSRLTDWQGGPKYMNK